MVSTMNQLVTRRTNTGGKLAHEWARLRTRRTALERARSWGLMEDPLTSLDELLAAVGFHTEPTQENERRLHDLVLIAADDELAARIVVQRILPGLLAVVVRRRDPNRYVFDELLGAAWIAIRTYNASRAPRSVAAALISDAEYAAFRAASRRKSSQEHPADIRPDDVRAHHEVSSCEELAELLAEAAASGVPDADLELIRQLLNVPTANELAAQLHVTPRTIRNRRDRVMVQLRAVARAA
jgi:hypothetical protein